MQPAKTLTPGDRYRAEALKLIEQYWDCQWARTIHHGDGEACVFLPFLGEFGHRWMYHVRRVHFSAATRKVVCISRGEEAMYPSATAFFYDWKHPIEDAQREGTDRVYRQWPEIAARFAGLTAVQGGGLNFELERRCILPSERIAFTPKRRGLQADVCIGTRSRGLNPRQNWMHCQLIADACRARGLTFATIAHPAVGYHLEGEVCMSGEFGDIDASIELLQNCRFYFGQDSGVAHMAATIGVPMAVLTVPHRIWAEEEAARLGRELEPWGRDFVDRMIEVNAPYPCRRIAAELWFCPAAVAAATAAEIRRTKRRRLETMTNDEIPMTKRRIAHEATRRSTKCVNCPLPIVRREAPA